MANRMTKVWRVGITHYDSWLVEVNNFSPKDQWRKLCSLDIKSITHLMTVSDTNSLSAKDGQSARTWNLPPLEWAILFHCRRKLLSCLVTYSQHTDGKPASFHPLPLPPCPPSLSRSLAVSSSPLSSSRWHGCLQSWEAPMPPSHPNHDAAANDLVCWVLTISV